MAFTQQSQRVVSVRGEYGTHAPVADHLTEDASVGGIVIDDQHVGVGDDIRATFDALRGLIGHGHLCSEVKRAAASDFAL